MLLQAIESVPNSDTCPTTPKQLSDQDKGTITSTASYPAHSACYWEITNMAKPFITLKPDSFETEEGYDYVYVSDMHGVVGYYSGKEPATNSISTDTGDVTCSGPASIMHVCS